MDPDHLRSMILSVLSVGDLDEAPFWRRTVRDDKGIVSARIYKSAGWEKSGQNLNIGWNNASGQGRTDAPVLRGRKKVLAVTVCSKWNRKEQEQYDLHENIVQRIMPRVNCSRCKWGAQNLMFNLDFAFGTPLTTPISAFTCGELLRFIDMNRTKILNGA